MELAMPLQVIKREAIRLIDNGTIQVIINKPSLRTIKMVDPFSHTDEEYKLSFPYVVFVANEKRDMYGVGMSTTELPNEIEDMMDFTAISIPPLMNLYSSGSPCTWSFKYAEGIKGFAMDFWSSKFDEVVDYGNRKRLSMSGLKDYKDWHKLSVSDPDFAMKHNWKPLVPNFFHQFK